MTDYSEKIKQALEILPNGAFLTTADDEKVNTMTIGWGNFGFQWKTPTVEVMVRESRFTKAALDKNMEFTLTFPTDSSAKPALGYCGTKSGRDTDKIKDCGIDIIPSKKIKTPVVSFSGLVFECRVVAKTLMQTELTDKEILDTWYKSGDLHTMYYAEILDCYEI